MNMTHDAAPEPRSAAGQRALEAHVAWWLERSQGAALDVWLEQTVDHALRNAEAFTLESVVHRDQVKTTALRYAAELPLTGGIPDLIADVAHALHAHPALDSARLDAFLPHEAIRTLTAKGIELRPLAERVLQELRDTAALQQFVEELVYQGLHHVLLQQGPWRRVGQMLPEAVAEHLMAEGAQRSAQLLTRSSQALLAAVDDEALQDAMTVFWDRLAELPLAPLRDGLAADDIDELTALAYAFWQELRLSPLYRGLIERAVEAVFARYGAMTLRALLDDLGIDRAMMLDEARRYAPRALAAMRENGVLEALIRRQLAPFYASAAFEQAIEGTSSA
ncbi:hypothetical protein KHP57_12085 [Algiphilus sp. NNCM1]|uniref:hypothetical protein n=1 Tax=Algiphilus sp. TaxID=1872431 RepID=UPI001CA76699|nr:hypothetical protein [Algiphilus sp.]MBY8966442.1 hypothetical protein [Algiphilus acroporae]MCI5104789.1 hypothetical protein [Algiphilus sp.]